MNEVVKPSVIESKTMEFKIFLAGILPDSIQHIALMDFVELEVKRHTLGKDRKPEDSNYNLCAEKVKRRAEVGAYRSFYEELTGFRMELRKLETASGNENIFLASKKALGIIIESAVSVGKIPLQELK